ncbi:MAG: UMP kinase [Rhodobiaceae bacterium]|nr:UMP kinase [Rhodobiaceae bacterium]
MARLKRVLLKLSGEALMGPTPFGVDAATLTAFARDIAREHEAGTEIAVVVGGGNFFRGVTGDSAGIARRAGDNMGMLATVMNALALQGALLAEGRDARVMSAVDMPRFCEPFNREAGLRHLAEGRIVVFGAGTGNPFFTTDTAAALRAAEMECDALLKATQVDGVYSADPKTDPNAVRYDELTAAEAIARNLKVMDTAAFALAQESGVPVIVFNIHEPGALRSVLDGTGRFTRVTA